MWRIHVLELFSAIWCPQYTPIVALQGHITDQFPSSEINKAQCQYKWRAGKLQAVPWVYTLCSWCSICRTRGMGDKKDSHGHPEQVYSFFKGPAKKLPPVCSWCSASHCPSRFGIKVAMESMQPALKVMVLLIKLFKKSWKPILIVWVQLAVMPIRWNTIVSHTPDSSGFVAARSLGNETSRKGSGRFLFEVLCFYLLFTPCSRKMEVSAREALTATEKM